MNLNLKLILVGIYCFCNLYSNAQNSFNYIGINNDFGLRHSGIKVTSNNLFSPSVTIYYGDTIPFVGLTLMKFDFDGNLFWDSLVGNLDTTFVIGNKTKFIGNKFITFAEVRFPSQPSKKYRQCLM